MPAIKGSNDIKTTNVPIIAAIHSLAFVFHVEVIFLAERRALARRVSDVDQKRLVLHSFYAIPVKAPVSVYISGMLNVAIIARADPINEVPIHQII